MSHLKDEAKKAQESLTNFHRRCIEAAREGEELSRREQQLREKCVAARIEVRAN